METATLIVPVDNELHLQTENGQVVVSSRVVAERFGKEHNKVVRVIENKIESLTRQNCRVKNLFIESTYNHNGNEYKEYLLTRDGFTFTVMGFTGAEADMWKLKYIEAFNKMEQALKEQQTLPKDLSPQLQFMINMELEQKKMQQQLNQVNHHALEAKATAEQASKQMEIVKDAMLLDHDSWRKDCNNIINKVAKERGGTREAYREVRDEVYYIVQQRAGANLKQRVINKQDRMRREGIAKSTIDKVCQIDVIAEDKRLKEIYIAVVKEMAVKYGVN